MTTQKPEEPVEIDCIKENVYYVTRGDIWQNTKCRSVNARA